MRVILMVNSECNVRCEHCYLPYSGSRDPEDALGVVSQLQSNGHNVVIAGSETLLNPDYLKAYQQAGQNYLLSNGIILDRDKSLYELLRQHGIEKLTFSIHFGIQQDLKSVPESLVARVIQESKRRGFQTQVTTTITSANYRSIDEMCHKSVNYGADTLQFDRLVQIGRGTRMESEALTAEQITEFFGQIVEVRKKYPKEVLEIKPHGNFGPRPGSKGETLANENSYCPAGRDLVAIDPQNRVYGCPFSMHPNSVIGRYENGQIVIDRELLDGKRDTCITHLLTSS